MTTYIRAETVPERCREYLTPGKLYRITNPVVANGKLVGADFIDDRGEDQHAYISCSAHLDNQPWQVVTHWPDGIHWVLQTASPDILKQVRDPAKPLHAAPVAAQAQRVCTCHPTDCPAGLCQEQYAASECQQADTLQAEGSWRHRLLSWVRSLF